MPKAAQPVAELVPAIERLGPRSGCAQLLTLIHPANLLEPNAGPSARNCNSLRRLLGTLRGFKATDSAEFRTGAIVEGTIGRKKVAFLAALDQAKKFKLIGISVPRGQVGTKSQPGVDFKAPAAAFVEALRAGDCHAAYAALAPFSRLHYANEKQFCSVFEANYMARPAGLGARLRADAGAALVDLGGTRDAHFFGLATAPAGYRTIVTGKLANGDARVTETSPVER